MGAQRFEVELTRAATEDLADIQAYIAESGSIAAAFDLLETMLTRIEALEQFPFRGSIPRELEKLGVDEFRQLVVGRYLLIYTIADQRVSIVLIADGRRDMKTLLRQRLLAPDR